MKTKTLTVWLIVVSAVALLAIVTAGIFIVRSFGGDRTSADGYYKVQLENHYQNSFSELLDNVDNIEVNLTKTLASSSPKMQRKLLSKVSAMSAAAQSNVASLPVVDVNIEKTSKFLNQAGDYSRVLNDSLGADGLSQGDKGNLTSLRDTAVNLKAKLYEVSDKLRDVNLSDVKGRRLETDHLSAGLDGIEKSNYEYPRLVYDGPFSDSIENTNEAALKGDVLSREQIELKIRDYLGDYRIDNITYKQKINKGFNILMFEVMTKDFEKMHVNMSETGGHLCQIDGYKDGDGKTERYNVDSCKEIAKKFAQKLSYDVEPVWASKTIDGYVYVSLCYTQDGVTVYPDMIKMTVDTATGSVVALEAYAYLLNHKPREIPKSLYTPETAKAKVDARLRVDGAVLTITPQGNNEVFCYEIKCADDSNQYLIYINALTLEEENILKIINNTEGYTVM